MTLMALASCTDYRLSNPYEETLNVLTVKAQWTLEETVPAGFKVQVEDMSTGAAYAALTDSLGKSVFNLPNGVYRVVMNGKDGDSIFNGSADRVAVSGKDVELSIALAMSKAGSIVIKEIYCGGCKEISLQFRVNCRLL